MKLTIGIKALNEERHIAASIESALAAIAGLDGEVVLADSGSTDRTIEIARRYPVRILQLSNSSDRSCGTGAQLAFQSARGEFFYLLDGDMILDPGFIPRGLAFLEDQPGYAAVGGLVEERNISGQEFQIRLATVHNDRNWLPGDVDRLDCGGLYRTEAINAVGYFADRNLHAFEEFELAARLRNRGWKLARIDHKGVDHFGHVSGGYRLLWRRVVSGYSGASGEVLRAAIGRGHLPTVLGRLSHVRVGVAVIMWWGLLLLSFFGHGLPWTTAVLVLVPLIFLSFRRGSVSLGAYSLAAWNVSALGLITGFFRKRISPMTAISARDLSAAADKQVNRQNVA